MDWLARTANFLPHHATRIPPVEAFEQEKAYLLPFAPIVMPQPALKAYTVRKTNEINYQGNFYSLPLGTYINADTKVWVEQKDGMLVIYSPQDKLLCSHELSVQKGKKIINNHHLRDTSSSIEELMQSQASQFTKTADALQYLEVLHKQYPRYIRDQLSLIKKALKKSKATPQAADKTLAICLKNQCYSASDFESVLMVVVDTHPSMAATSPRSPVIKALYSNGREKAAEMPAKSDIEDYEQIVRTITTKSITSSQKE